MRHPMNYCLFFVGRFSGYVKWEHKGCSSTVVHSTVIHRAMFSYLSAECQLSKAHECWKYKLLFASGLAIVFTFQYRDGARHKDITLPLLLCYDF